MKNFFKRFASILLIACLTTFYALPVFADASPGTDTGLLKAEITQTAEYIRSNTTLNVGKDFYKSTKTLILLLRSRIDCTQLTNEYFTQLDAAYYKNSDLTLGAPLTDYALLSTVLALTNKSATDYRGVNILSKFESAVLSASQEDLDEINPYELPLIYLATLSYSNELQNSDQILNTLKDTILNYANDNGINYWGNSADNNGFVLSGLSSIKEANTEFDTLVKNALVFSQTLLNADGTTNGYYNGATDPNADSTAASLSFFSTYGLKEQAQLSYQALSSFRNADGSYYYTKSDLSPNSFATADAFYGLLAHYSVLTNQAFPFYVADVLEAKNSPVNNNEPDSKPTVPAPVATEPDSPDASAPEDTTSSVSTETTISASQEVSSPATADHTQIFLIEVLFILSAFSLVISIKKVQR